VTQGAEKLDGFLTLYRKEDRVYLELKPNQFDQPVLAPITIARGLAAAGVPLTREDEMVLVFRKSDDRIQLIRRNVHYRAPAGTPVEKAVKQNYTDSILLALPIVTINPMTQGTLIDLNGIFLTDFAQLGLGNFDPNRSRWSKVKNFPNNVELQVEATYGMPNRGRLDVGDSGVVDQRGLTVVIHYSLMKLPDPGYRPRYADDRVGHFLSAVKDFGRSEDETTFVRMVNRWRLEKADPKAKLSPPRKQIVFYVEDNVPYEYRPFVEEGIREWNKAFEAIGFRDAITVRWQQPGEEFDPEDTNYCTFRWITTSRTYAMSCMRANPLTGELIDGDVIFDASWIKAWKDQYAVLTGVPTPKGSEADLAATQVLARGEIISPIQAAREGFGLLRPEGARRIEDDAGRSLELVPGDWSLTQAIMARRLASSQAAQCQFSIGMQSEMGLALLALAKADPKEGDSRTTESKLPEELLGQAIKEVTMHEVGHSLGLRHNFKASTMLTSEQLNDTTITRAKGNTGSVMDYAPINLAPKGQKQGDYFSTTIGPYDYWAIEYAYAPIDGNEEAELAKIAARAPESALVFASDEDMYANNDPNVNVYDLGSDPCLFAKERMALASELLKEIDSKAVKDGESWARARKAFSYLLNQWGNAASLAAQHIGGQYVSRHHKGDKDAKDPVVPVSGAKQRDALALLVGEIFSDKAFAFSPQTLRRLGVERWSHWGNDSMGGVDYPIHGRILGIQRIALAHCLSADVLARLQNQELQADPESKPLGIAELLRTITEGIWSDLDAPKPEDQGKDLVVSTIRRNLQREHLKRLSTMVLGQSRSYPGDSYIYVIFEGGSEVPADARALTRMHLGEIRSRIDKTLGREGVKIDDTTRAHLAECRDRITKVLDASMQSD
jgi:hypothetical protein